MSPPFKPNGLNTSPFIKNSLFNGNYTMYSDQQFLRISTVTIDYFGTYNERPNWKETVDIFFGLIGIIILLILYPFITLGIKLSSSGPVLFKQKRTGLNGRTFICYKFRTMHCNQPAPANGGPDITQEKDSRIFKFGEFLRRTNLDEIPQFINVIKGDMSIVGPRPYPVEENSHWNSTFPDFYKRFAVRPGLTGLAQATGYRGGTLDLIHMRERLRRDLIYIEERSLAMDLRVIQLTAHSMLTLNTHAH